MQPDSDRQSLRHYPRFSEFSPRSMAIPLLWRARQPRPPARFRPDSLVTPCGAASLANRDWGVRGTVHSFGQDSSRKSPSPKLGHWVRRPGYRCFQRFIAAEQPANVRAQGREEPVRKKHGECSANIEADFIYCGGGFGDARRGNANGSEDAETATPRSPLDGRHWQAAG